MTSESARFTRTLSSDLLPNTLGRFRLDEVESTILGETTVTWWILDAEEPDEFTGCPAVVVMQATREKAMSEWERIYGAEVEAMLEGLDDWYDDRTCRVCDDELEDDGRCWACTQKELDDLAYDDAMEADADYHRERRWGMC